jgi:hypothetical protein
MEQIKRKMQKKSCEENEENKARSERMEDCSHPVLE